MAVVLIGSTGSGKSTLGNFLIDPSEEHISINPTFLTARDNKPFQTQFAVAKQVQYQRKPHQSVSLTIVDTQGLNESAEKDLECMFDIITKLKRAGKIQACLFVIQFNSKIDGQYRATLTYYNKLLPTLFRQNTAIVMTNFATDERSVAIRKMQGIDVEKVKEDTAREIVASAGMSYNPAIFTIDCLPIGESESKVNMAVRESILDYICDLKPIPSNSLQVYKPHHIRMQDKREIQRLSSEIGRYMYQNPNLQVSGEKERNISERQYKIAKLSQTTMTIDEAILTQICGLCAGSFKSEEEMVRCEGDCKKLLHNYCAGTSTEHYKRLAHNSTPFVCLVCTQALHKTELQTLHSEIQNLQSVHHKQIHKEEPEDRAVTTKAGPTSTGVRDESQLVEGSFAFQELKKTVEQLQASVADATKRNEDRVPQSVGAQTAGVENKLNKFSDTTPPVAIKNPKSKVTVPGARRLWGTMQETTTAAVISTITKLTSVSREQISVRRKYKTINENGHYKRWWFVLRGEEEVLSELESKWEIVKLQTNWKLEPLLMFSDST